jgi:hypothetical protein
MQTKPAKSERPPLRGDTSSSRQQQGTQTPRTSPQPKMPHERDESTPAAKSRSEPVRPTSDARISQAHDDVVQGKVDTDRRGTPSDIPSERK